MNLNNTHLKYISIIIIIIFLLYFMLKFISYNESFIIRNDIIRNDIMNIKKINHPLGKAFDIDNMCKKKNILVGNVIGKIIIYLLQLKKINLLKERLLKHIVIIRHYYMMEYLMMKV